MLRAAVPSLSSAPRELAGWADRVDGPTLIAWGLCAALLPVFLLVPYLPMVDLPQHSALISAWLHFDVPAFPETANYALNFRTPYLTAYVVARALAAWIGVTPALKLVSWLCVALHLFAFVLLTRTLGHPRWLSVLGLPLGLGYGFYFGLISFILALPLALFSISATLRHRERPTSKSALVLAGLLCLTLVTHGFVLGLTLASVGPLVLRGNGRLSTRLAPLFAPLVLGAIWLLPGSSIQSIGATIWEPRLLDLQQLPGLLLASSGADHAASLFGSAILALLALGLGRPSRTPERWAPLAIVIGGYCLFPLMLSGFGPLHPRFAAFVPAGLLLAFEPRPVARWSKLPVLASGLCAGWFGLLGVRLWAFTQETQPIRSFVERMPSGLSVRPIVFERESVAFPSLPALLHLSAYYAAEKGGLQGYSFAMYPTSVVRYRPTVVPGMGSGAEWQPETFSAESELGLYDVFLVHSEADRSQQLFGDRLEELELAFCEKGWWAYVSRASIAAHARGGRRC